jgi:predicted PurR-regulated permease PerM
MAGFSADKVKQTYFLVTLTILGCLLAFLLRDYISSLLGATTIYILLRRPLSYLTEIRKWHKTATVILLMLLSMVVLILPLGLVSVMLSSKAEYMVQHYAEFLQILKGWNNLVSDKLNINLLSDDTLHKVTVAGANVIPAVLSATVSSLTQILIMYLLLYFIMKDGRRIEKWIIDNSPFRKENTALLAHALKAQTLSNAIGLSVLGVSQAIFSGIGYWIFGLDEPFFWGVITGFAGVIPVVGTTIIWVPLTIYMYFAGGPHWHAIAVAIYCVLVLTNVDNVVRFSLMKKLGDTHPLIIFFGIMIGVNLFGFLGLIFGPLLISYFLILLEIYQKEYLPNEIPMEKVGGED